MTRYFAALTALLMMGMVLTRVFIMKRQGVEAMHSGKIDKTDYLIPPFALFYFYLIFAAAFGWPAPSSGEFFDAEAVGWIGVALCLGGLTLLAWSLVSFGQSFRVGIDTQRPDKLITSGIFALSRNPIYVGFALILLGQFLIFPNWLCWSISSRVTGSFTAKSCARRRSWAGTTTATSRSTVDG